MKKVKQIDGYTVFFSTEEETEQKEYVNRLTLVNYQNGMLANTHADLRRLDGVFVPNFYKSDTTTKFASPLKIPTF